MIGNLAATRPPGAGTVSHPRWIATLVWLRRAGRLAALVAVLGSGALEIGCRLFFAPPEDRAQLRATWLRAICRRLLRVFGIRASYEEMPPTEGLLVCNHLSYLDIIVLAAHQPMTFVSKREVRDWPGIGWLTRCAGTLYIDREQKADVLRVGAQLTSAIGQGVVVCIFPEGTSSDGSAVLPFRPSLLQPAVNRGWPVTPAHLSYGLADGSVEEEVCYWRDMSFGPHLLNLLGKKEITARVAYGSPMLPLCDRKELARTLRAEVAALADKAKQVSDDEATALGRRTKQE